jgi:hypothetical protein
MPTGIRAPAGRATRYRRRVMSTPPVDPQEEFRDDYEVAMESWLRRRFTFFCIFFFALETVVALTGIVARFIAPERFTTIGSGLSFIAPMLSAILVGLMLWNVRPRLERRLDLILAANLLILLLGVIDLGVLGAIEGETVSTGGFLLWVFAMHLASTALLPWTPRESLYAVGPLYLVWVAIEAIIGIPVNPLGTTLALGLSPLVLLPGLAIAHFRMRRWSRRFRSEAVTQGFLSLRREMSQARTIHESLFPRPQRDDLLDFDFEFRPMRDLGGDFIHASRTPEGRLRVLLLDVTGHGLAAAMTVTRLSGEIERIIAEQPDIGPAALLQCLNHYTELLLSQHSIFATAVVAEVDPMHGMLRYANAGHPPAFLKANKRPSRRLGPTAMLLGAVPLDDYECGETRERFEPGDVVVLYTDGCTESRDRRGKMLGIDGLERAMDVPQAPRRWTTHLVRFAESFQTGRNEDDILVATISRLAGVAPTEPVSKRLTKAPAVSSEAVS